LTPWIPTHTHNGNRATGRAFVYGWLMLHWAESVSSIRNSTYRCTEEWGKC
jgi:hypothetical protein